MSIIEISLILNEPVRTQLLHFNLSTLFWFDHDSKIQFEKKNPRSNVFLIARQDENYSLHFS